jgi:hypothetical protein
MSEHTWLSHDLPPYEATPESPPLNLRWRAQVFKGVFGWDWTHQCGPKLTAGFAGYLTQGTALTCAREHMKEHE